jgi:hypothetical protein
LFAQFFVVVFYQTTKVLQISVFNAVAAQPVHRYPLFSVLIISTVRQGGFQEEVSRLSTQIEIGH